MTTETVERRQRQRPETTSPLEGDVEHVSTAVRSVARVDLVPPIVETRRRHAATERKLIAGVLALLVLVVVAGLAVAMMAMSAENALTAERTRAQVLINEQKQYSEVSSVKSQLGAYEGAELVALYSEADWSRLMTELDSVLPEDVTLATESITVKGVSDAGPSIESTGLDAPGVIEISFTANAARFDSPTPLLNALSRLTGYVSATVDAVASNESGYLITGVVQLGSGALGGTQRVTALDAEQIAQLHEALGLAATTTPDAASSETTDDADATSAGE